MPKINPRIKSIDDLLGLDAAEESPIEPTPSVSLPTKNTIITLPPQAIRAFRGHPFRLYEGDRLNDLVESISEHGVLNPAIIRKIERDEDGFEYEMLAGHNRQNAAAIANRELPCIVKENLSDEDAWIYVIETNVLQRSFSEMLPSEKAAVLALRYSKMICQGRRNDIIEELKRLENPDEIRENPTSGTQCHRTKSRDILGAEYDLKGRAVANYLRINELITPLKRRIDDAEFPIVVAVQLSYLTEQEQKMVDDGTDNIGGYGCGPTSMAIVVSSLTDQTVDPPTMAEWAYQNGYWCSGNGSYHSLIPGAAEGFGLQWESISTDDPQAVVDALASGKLIVALMSKGHFTSSGHFMVLRGVTSEGKILVADPASKKRSEQEWDISIILDEARKGAAAGGPLWAIY